MCEKVAYGVFKKKGWHCYVVFDTKEKALKSIHDRKDMEVREIIYER